MWRDLSDRITSFLSSISLEELVNNEEVMDVADRQDNEKRHAINGRLQETIVNMRV